MKTRNTVAGSRNEKKILDRIKSKLIDIVDSVDILKIPVYTWSSSCTIRIGGIERECVLLPYTPGIETYVHGGSIITGDVNRILGKDLLDKVVLIEYPDTYEEFKWITYLISMKNPQLIIFVVKGDFLKSDVVLGTPGYTYASTILPSIPVISVDQGTSRLMLNMDFQVKAVSGINTGEAGILIAELNGKGENSIHITTHHDTLLGDYAHISTSLLIKLAEALKKQDLPANTMLISYTAREIGDYEFTEYHYTWGERYLLRIMESRGELDRVIYSVSIGPVHAPSKIRIVGHPALFPDLREVLNRFEFTSNHALLESKPYLDHGIPALTITSLMETWRIHNSTYKYLDEREEVIDILVDTVVKIINNLKAVDNWVEYMRKHVIEKLDKHKLDIRVEAAKIIDLAGKQKPSKGAKTITRLMNSTMYLACSDPLRVYLVSGLLENLSMDSAFKLREILSSCKGISLIGDNRAYKISSIKQLVKQYVDLIINAYLGEIVTYLRNQVSNEISKIILDETIRGGNILELEGN